MTNLYLDTVVNILKTSLTTDNITLEKFSFPTYINIAIGKINVRFDGKQPILNIPDDINKEYVTIWKSSAGKILTKDLRNHDLDNYYYVSVDDCFYLLRRIDSDFYTTFPMFDNDFDISYVDNKYIIISISDNELFNRSIESNDFDIQIEEDEETDEIIEIQHVPLFEADDLAGGY